MTAKDNIEERLEKLGRVIGSDDSIVESVMSRIDAKPIAQSSRIRKLRNKLLFRRFIMNRFSKLAAAAVIIIAAATSIILLDKSATSAYALEQTIRACHTVRDIHIRQINPEYDEPLLIWAKFDEIGNPTNIRLHLPEWSEGPDGPKIGVWKDGKTEVWVKKKNIFITIRDKSVAAKIVEGIKESDPKLFVQHLYDLRDQGEVKIKIDEPADRSEPIVVTATYLPESSKPNARIVLFVDQATRLVLSAELYKLVDGNYVQKQIIEFYDYNQPIDEKMFVLDDEIPADAMRIDQTIQEVGLEKGGLSDEEIAEKVAREFFEALIAKDYAKAGKLMEGIPGEFLEKSLEEGKMNFVRIISIGPAGPHPNPKTGGLVVPCIVEVEKDGQIIEQKFDRLGVRPVYNQLNRWTIFGGI